MTTTYISPQKYGAELRKFGMTEKLYRQALSVKTPAHRPIALEMIARWKRNGMLKPQHVFPFFPSQYNNPARPPAERRAARRQAWKRREGLRLAERAGYVTDEHGTWNRGDHIAVNVIDYIPPWEAAAAPFLDLGGEGMALIAVERKRVYARSSRWSPSYTTDYYVVGRNESGTYFGHAVTKATTLAEAIAWMWQGYEVTQRQGDIALANGGRSGYVPALPLGHVVEGGFIVHDQHPPLPLPQQGQRIVVARRATPTASRQTRD